LGEFTVHKNVLYTVL